MSVGNAAKDNYIRLIRAALHITIKEIPFSDFLYLIELQQAENLSLVRLTEKHVPNSLKFLLALLELTFRILYKHQTFYPHFSMDSNLRKFSQKKNFCTPKLLSEVKLLNSCLNVSIWMIVAVTQLI